MSKVRLCFLGTPAFALTALNGVLADDHYEVVGVITQPDRPAGRRMKLQQSAVKKRALELSIPVLCPEKLNVDEAAIDMMKSWKPDVSVVVAFGQILSQAVLDLPTYGSVNLHASLLPRWRGAAPIQRSIEFGDTHTGVALQKMVKKLDAGDVLGHRELKITDEMDAIGVHDALAELGVELLQVELMDFVRGNLSAQIQDEELATYAKKIEKHESRIDWTLPCRQIFNKIRAFQMGPGCFSVLNEKKVKIHRTMIHDGFLPASEPGQLNILDDDSLVVACAEGGLKILQLQPESKPRMAVENYLTGYRTEIEKIILAGGKFVTD